MRSATGIDSHPRWHLGLPGLPFPRLFRL